MSGEAAGFGEREYRTLRRPGRSELEIKRSRFFGLAWPLVDEADFTLALKEARRRHLEAGHHAFAFRLGHAGEIARFSDDGEPGGTAGRPIMEMLLRQNLADAAVIVSRIFGGTLLGSGGLTRAYSQAATEAVRAAGPATMLPHREVRVTVDYTYFGALEHALPREGLPLLDAEFAAAVHFLLRVPIGGESALRSLLGDITKGSAVVESLGTVYLPE